MYQVISFYGFVDIDNPEVLRDAQRALCQKYGLLGRIYVAQEGINATCAGSVEAVQHYQTETQNWPGFDNLLFKIETVDRIPFADLRVKVRPHLVNLGECNNVDPHTEGGDRLKPKEWKAFMESGRSYTILDVRNDYEGEVGRFEGAKIPPYRYFHQFPQWAKELNLDPEQPILMYCTGGIRCEKFSGVLKREGYKEVYQLDGGILQYAAEVGGDHFIGDVVVFDDRMTIDIGGAPSDASCIHCGQPTTRLVNCANVDCHKLHLSCEACIPKTKACCCEACQTAPRVRTFEPEHLDHPWRRLHHEDIQEEQSQTHQHEAP